MAVQIVEIHSNRLKINTDALSTILDRAGDHPVAIVSVNGPMRSGKSYIINHFLRYLKAAPNEDWFHWVLTEEFHWKNSAERQTTGIMVWPEPQMVLHNGRKVAIFLVDTQGCFDDKTTIIENALLFAFSCLLSSVLVFNFKNQISEDLLQFMQFFVGHARAIIDQEDSDSFAKLLLLIRDWQFPGDFPFGVYDDEHTPADGRNFKTEKLNTQPEMAPESHVVRQELASSFRDITCCLMPYPGNGLACQDRTDNLDPEFMQTIKNFVPQIFNPKGSITKVVGGKEVNASELKQLVQTWADLFASAEIPSVQNVAEATAEVQNAVACSVALKFYQGEMKNVVEGHNGLPEEDLSRLHTSKKQEAVTIYRQMRRIRQEEVQRKYAEVLTGDIDRSFAHFQEMNLVTRNMREAKEADARKTEELLKQQQELDERSRRNAHRHQEIERRRAQRRARTAALVGNSIRMLFRFR